MSLTQELSLPRDFGPVDPSVYDALRSKLGTGWSARYFFDGDNCTRINVASDDGQDIRGIPVVGEQRLVIGRFATSLLDELGIMTDGAHEWLFADGFRLHSITYDTRHVSPRDYQRQSQPHFDVGKALFTGEHFGPAYLLQDEDGNLKSSVSDGGTLVGHDQTNLHHSRPSPLQERASRAVIKISATLES